MIHLIVHQQQLSIIHVNSLGLKNPYDKTQKVAQSNVCTSGSIAITEKEVGSV